MAPLLALKDNEGALIVPTVRLPLVCVTGCWRADYRSLRHSTSPPGTVGWRLVRLGWPGRRYARDGFKPTRSVHHLSDSEVGCLAGSPFREGEAPEAWS